jgi:hypothetical protein
MELNGVGDIKYINSIIRPGKFKKLPTFGECIPTSGMALVKY